MACGNIVKLKFILSLLRTIVERVVFVTAYMFVGRQEYSCWKKESDAIFENMSLELI